jgi:hypothetical protein
MADATPRHSTDAPPGHSRRDQSDSGRELGVDRLGHRDEAGRSTAVGSSISNRGGPFSVDPAGGDLSN